MKLKRPKYSVKFFKQMKVQKSDEILKMQISMIENEYLKVQEFLGKNEILMALSSYLESLSESKDLADREKLDKSFNMLKTIIDNYYTNILHWSERRNSSSGGSISKIFDEINGDNPSFNRVSEYYEVIKMRLAGNTNNRKMEILSECTVSLAELTQKDTKCTIL